MVDPKLRVRFFRTLQGNELPAGELDTALKRRKQLVQAEVSDGTAKAKPPRRK